MGGAGDREAAVTDQVTRPTDRATSLSDRQLGLPIATEHNDRAATRWGDRSPNSGERTFKS